MKLKGGALLSLRKPLVFVIFALLIFGVFLSTFVFMPSIKKAHAAGTTYYVRADGTAIKTNAIGPTSDATKCMSQTTFTSSTFSSLDIIYFSGLGAADYTNLTIPSSGTLNNLITYQGLTDGRGVGGYPIIATSGISINTNSKSFITVSGFDVEYAGASASDIHAYVPGTVSYVTLSNLTLNGHGYGYGIDVAGSVSNIILSDITISNIGVYYGVWFPGATNSTVSISNLTTSGGRGMLLKNINGLTMTNVISNATFSASYSSLNIEGGSGILTINGYSSTGSLARGLYINGGSYTTISITNVTSDSAVYAAGIELMGVSASSSIEISYPTVTNSYVGVYLTNLTSPSIQLLNGAIYNNGAGIINDGVPGTIIRGFNPLNIANGGIHDNNIGSGSGVTVLATSGNSNNMIIEDNWIYNNGYPYTTAPYNANHDGIDMHANCGNAIIRNNIIVNNGNAGLALVLTSSGAIYNNVIAYNGSNNGTPSTSTARGGFYNSGSGSWALNNNILMNNYPYEYNINNSVLPPVTLSNNNIFLHDRDSNPLFHNVHGDIGYTLADWQSAFDQDINSYNTNPFFINTSGNYSQAADFQLQSTSPAIDAGIDVGLTTDYLNHAIYGAPDIGAYEYQPPEVMGTNKIDIGAGARVYADGSFRNLSTASGTSANLTITPQSGSFTVGNHALWMDVVIVIWNNTGIYHKSWTETSTVDGLNNTVHKVGDLAPNKYYNVKVDGVLGANMTGSYCTAGLCLADNNGIITFTYTGGYSTHTFDVEAEPATVASSGSSNSSTPTTSSTPVAKFPETGIPPSHNNIPRNIFALSGVLALVLTSLIVVLRKRRRII